MPVDADTKRFLDEAKKGKPRRFAMVCKGVKIVSLIAYKRGTEDKYKKEAKKVGKGQFYGGVISGKGENITFELLRESCDRAPVKDLTLKAFLADEAGMKFKPTFAVVDQLTPISEADDESEVAPSETGADSTVEGPDLAALWKERAAALTVNIKQLKSDQVDLSGFPKLTVYIKGAQEFAKKGEYEKAHKIMDEVERQVAEAMRQGRQAEAAGGIAKGRVKKQVYLRERWSKVPGEVDARVAQLQPKIGPELTTQVNEALQELIDDINENIQDSVDRGAADFGPVIKVIRSAKDQVQGNDLIQHLESHPTVGSFGVQTAFLDALNDLEMQLAG